MNGIIKICDYISLGEVSLKWDTPKKHGEFDGEF